MVRSKTLVSFCKSYWLSIVVKRLHLVFLICSAVALTRPGDCQPYWLFSSSLCPSIKRRDGATPIKLSQYHFLALSSQFSAQ